MLNAERRQYILETLQSNGRVVASELSAGLKVSEDTIRRDLRELAEAGLLQRVHGGALALSPALGGYAVRQQQAPSAKARIGRAAAELIRDGQVVLLDGGTSVLEVAHHLPPELRATIITPSPPIAVALSEHPHVEVIVLGGQLYKHSVVAIGAATMEALSMVRADLFILGVGGLHPEVGISTGNLEEGHVKRMMINRSAEVVALVSAEKINTAAPYIVGPLTDLTHIVTEQNVPEVVLTPYQALGITILRV